MSNPSSIIEYAVIDRHNVSDIPEYLDDIAPQFSVLRIKTKKVEITKKPLFMLFTIDRTGSMSDRSGSSGTKLSHLKQTFKNMISYFSKLEGLDIYVRVHAFNDKVEYTIETVKITPEIMNILCQKIDNIRAEGLTAIDAALTEANQVMTRYVVDNPTHSCVHIFMTDGEPSIGSMDPVALSEMVSEIYPNIFVGFGNSHNASLLRKLSEKKLSEYQFVDSAENSALMYGEAIHRFLYPAITDVDIIMTNGLIYDWQTNTWVTEIHESIIIGLMEKIYHIKESNEGCDTETAIWGIPHGDDSGTKYLLDTAYCLPILIDSTTDIPMVVDCTKYLFRQKVQEVLYEARGMDEFIVDRASLHAFKKKLAELFRNMRKYMRENGLLSNGFMKTLCDDVSILYNSIGTNTGLMFAMSRQSSQGRQATYTPGRGNQGSSITGFASYKVETTAWSPTPLTPPLRSTTPISRVVPMTPRYRRNNRVFLDESFMEESQLEGSDEDSGNDSDNFSTATVIPGFEEEDEITTYVSDYTNTSCYTTESVMRTIGETQRT